MSIKNTIFLGDCRLRLKDIPDNSIDAVVTDPPYELGFMGKSWDASGVAYNVSMWEECLRVLKPGGHLLSFGGTRTYHRMACAVEDAGFEIRDQMQWLYGTGFPKNHDISKAMTDKEAAATWEGWGTALKPANEPIVLARKPIAENTIALNVLKHGTGGLNIDGSRIYRQGKEEGEVDKTPNFKNKVFGKGMGGTEVDLSKDRWPSNVLLDSEAALILGSVSRFFYCAKASTDEREKGLEGRERKIVNDGRETSIDNPYQRGDTERLNTHPTVKPITLMEYLVRLVTPKGGIVLDPFSGSGSTLIAAKNLGFDYLGIEMDPEFVDIANMRLRGSKTLSKFFTE